ncbi:OmpA family protein [Lysobacter sp. A3-1-A15]|uniref:OmpA family protein n=1 Tax=Novilysobacter viscosus TaxID=3098602 RepID=UPI002ED7F225
MNRRNLAMSLAAFVVACSAPAIAQDASADLAQRLTVLESNAELGSMAPYERLQARQALEVLAAAGNRDRDGARYVAERRVRIAEVAAGTAAAQREIDRLDRERSELLIEASRQDAAQARAEAERLRMEARIQAEEAARLREQAMSSEAAMQDVEAALEGVAGAQSARLQAAREREAELARQEAALMAGAGLPPVTRRGGVEVYTLGGDAFGSGQATLTAGAASSVQALAAYLQGSGNGSIRVEGHTDSQGQPEANRALSQRRADAVRQRLIDAGLPASRIRAIGHGDDEPVADNATAEGRARNRRVEVLVGG